MNTITLPRGCKPSKVAGTDKSRPILLHGYLKRHDDTLYMCATNSYMAVAVPVDGDGKEGWVPIQVLRALEANRTATAIEQLDEHSWSISNGDGTSVTHTAGDKLSRFPDLASVGLWEPPEVAGDLVFGFNAHFAAQVAAALGGAVRCTVTGKNRRIHFEAIDVHDSVGLLMPIRVDL